MFRSETEKLAAIESVRQGVAEGTLSNRTWCSCAAGHAVRGIERARGRRLGTRMGDSPAMQGFSGLSSCEFSQFSRLTARYDEARGLPALREEAVAALLDYLKEIPVQA